MSSEEETKDPKYRQYGMIMTIVISILAVGFTLYHVAYICGFLDMVKIYLDQPLHLAMHMGFLTALIFILVPAGKKAGRKKLPFYDIILGILGVGWNLYILINYEALYMRSVSGNLLLYETIWICINILIVLEASRRVMGPAIPVIVSLFIVYTLTSQYLPGFLFSRAHSWERIGPYVGLFVSGMYGGTLNISATILVSFIFFAQFLFVTGAGEWFIRVSEALLGHVRGGPAKVAVLASAMMGTLSGSGMANVAATGVFTIPLMKKTGYKAYFAGAVEAAASNGGQIMPPVMGVAAFLMVDFLGMSYSRIATAAILPALAYFLGVFMMVDLEAAKSGLAGVPREQLPRLKDTIMEGWQFMIPILLLFFLLMGLQYSPEYSALIATGVLLVIGVINKKNRVTIKKIYLALKDTAIAMMMMATVLALAGVIIGCVQLTGLSYRLSMGLVNLAGGNAPLLLLLTALVSILLGMGMTTSAVYIMLAVLVAPAIIEMGFLPLATHFYVFYFGVSALLTPPVAPTAYVAAGIADSEPIKTGIQASALAVAGFIAPVIFIYHPALLMVGTALEVILTAATTFLAVIAFAVGFSGYLFGHFNFLWRIPLFVGALMIVHPSTMMTFIGSGLILAEFALLFLISKSKERSEALRANHEVTGG